MLKFILQYIKKPRTTGAILPSSKYLAQKMVANIDFAEAKCIVEYGPGTGVFTEKLLSRRHKDTKVILIERNEEFYFMLKDKFSDQSNLQIVNDSAENIGKYLAENNIDHADYIISGLPFASLPSSLSENILEQTKKYLKPGGKFITFQYTLFKANVFARFFTKPQINWEVRNVPPAYVLTFQK
ncbi:MAG: methyltransferase domain-containing protein [Defluviitaleaceae bacterium]|nr:methyltransferase domain-containing protein [Defluviitaleaceae bacterium]